MTYRTKHRCPADRALTLEALESRRMLASINISPYEQLLLELVNRARRDPAAEAARFSIDLNAGLPAGTVSSAPKQPLAPNQLLSNASALHSQDMLDRDYFAHDTPEGKTAGQRASDAGYTGTSVRENIHWNGSTIEGDRLEQTLKAHESLFRSAGHRWNMLAPANEEMGPGVRFGKYASNGIDFHAIMVTELFGVAPNLSFVTGVAFTDSLSRDDFYSIGEQLSDVTVRARTANGTIFETVTGPSGAYALGVPNGTYDIVFTHPSQQGEVVQRGIVIQDGNVKLDLNLATAIWTQPGRLTLALDRTSIAENAGAGAAVLTISRAGSDLSQSILVGLVSNDPTEATVPATVEIPSGVSSVLVGINAIDDSLFDGTQTLQIQASSPGHAPASVSLSVTDHQPLTLAVQLGQLNEENSALRSTTAQLSLRSPAPPNGLTVLLASDQPSQLIHPAAVFVPAGESRVEFQVSVVDDFAPQGTRHAILSATAPGTIAASVDLVLTDADPALWTNPRDPHDVDNNNSVDPLDVLAVINEINLKGQRLLHPDRDRDLPFIDTNADGRVDPLDVLELINTINAQ
jgi:uncharacterized protein YkwD